jgi:hypothetical protein
VEHEAIRIASARRELLQVFRAMQAVSEAGYRILVPQDEIARWDYARRWFDLAYAMDPGEGPSVQLHIDHERPEVSLGSLSRPLLFAHVVVGQFQRAWSDRPVLASFAGNMTRTRGSALRQWRKTQFPRRAGRSKSIETRVIIRSSSSGRSWPEKAWDQGYVSLLGSSQFALCPDGDFIWTYRFFEATMAGAIPIVEHDCPLYEGFRFARMSDDIGSLEWSEAAANHNRERVQRLITAPNEDLRAAVERALRP